MTTPHGMAIVRLQKLLKEHQHSIKLAHDELAGQVLQHDVNVKHHDEQARSLLAAIQHLQEAK